jgi:hypothetical protein
MARNALNSVPKFIVWSAERSPRRNCTETSAAMKLTRMRKRVMFTRPYILPKTASWKQRRQHIAETEKVGCGNSGGRGKERVDGKGRGSRERDAPTRASSEGPPE